jgi:hypothetical protein
LEEQLLRQRQMVEEEGWKYLRELARMAELSPAALQKELTALAATELVLTRRDCKS